MAGAWQAFVQPVNALPPPIVLGQSQANAARQAWQAAGEAVKPAKRPYKRRVPAAAGSLQTAAFNATSMVGQVSPLPFVEHPLKDWWAWHGSWQASLPLN